MQYAKPPLTHAQQVDLLRQRGLAINDVAGAEMYLSQISYYRLSAYFYPFQSLKDVFNTGTTFQQILDVYSFDREFRLLVLDEIERIEVAFRAQVIYQLAHKYGPHWQDDATIFAAPRFNAAINKTTYVYAEVQDIISKQCSIRVPEVFIKHYINKYSKPVNPPSWMCIELLTIGELSRLYNALKHNADKKDIAAFFNLHHSIFSSWVHTIVYVRNICAHHSRLWNREFGIMPDVLRQPKAAWVSPLFNSNNHRVFYFLCMLKYLLGTANPTGNFKNKLEGLFNKYPAIPIQFMGIPSHNGTLVNWMNEPLWK